MTEYPSRKRLRLKDFDYSQYGYYFITICTQKMAYLFGEIDTNVGQELCSCRLTPMGKVIQNEWHALKNRYENIQLDKFTIMPNHVHGIIVMGTQERHGQSPCPTLSQVVGANKSITTKICNRNDSVLGRKIWQTSFYDRIIRNDVEYRKIWEYIDTNPIRWLEDKYY